MGGNKDETVQVDTRDSYRKTTRDKAREDLADESAPLLGATGEIDPTPETVRVDTRASQRKDLIDSLGPSSDEVLARTGEATTDETVQVDTRSHAAEIEPDFVTDLSGSVPSETVDRSPSDSGTGSTSSSGRRLRAMLQPGDRIGKYEVQELVARGGMGVVYKARHVGLDRSVALKVMRSGDLATEVEKQRFLREAESAAKLSHPHIVPVNDIGLEDDFYYFTMDYVEGRSLDVWFEEEEPTLETYLRLMVKVADAVASAHIRGIIHRDLKPSNILVDTNGDPHIMDFGLAKELHVEETEEDGERSRPITLSGIVMGTPNYMPPEQAEGRIKEIDIRSDVYALGVVMYEMIGGERPFEGENVHAVLRKIFEVDPPPLRRIDPTIPWEVETIVQKAMMKEKPRRYQSAQDLRDDLKRFLRGRPIRARKTSIFYRMRKFIGRHPGPVAATAVAVVALLVAAGVWTYQRAQHRREKAATIATALDDANALFRAASDKLRDLESDLDRWSARPDFVYDQAWRDEITRRLVYEDGAATLLNEARRAFEQIRDQYGSERAADKLTFVLPPVERELESLRNQLDRRYQTYQKAQARHRALREGQEQLERVRTQIQTVRQDLENTADAAALDRIQGDLVVAETRLGEVAKLIARHDLTPLKSVREGLARDVGRLQESATSRQAALEERIRTEKALASHLRLGRQALEAAREEIAKGNPAKDEVKRHYREATGHFRSAADLDPAHREPYVNCLLEHAAYLRDLGGENLEIVQYLISELDEAEWDEYREAIDAFKETVRRAKERESDFRNLLDQALGHSLRGRWTLARKTYEKALKEVPQNRDALFGHAIAEAREMERDRKFTRSFALLNRAAELADDARDERDLARTRLDCLVSAFQHHLEEARRLQSEGALEAAAGVLAQANTYPWPEEALHLIAGKPAESARRLRSALEGLRREIESRSQVPEGMIYVPGGRFLYGGESSQVAPFYVARYEVTNAEYAAFVADGGYEDSSLWSDVPAKRRSSFVRKDGGPGPATWSTPKPPQGRERHPVTGICLAEAQAYARWRSRQEKAAIRLLTEREWAYIVTWDPRKDDVRLPPWREGTWDNWADYFHRENPLPVDANLPEIQDAIRIEDRTCHNLYGNVHEWTQNAIRGGGHASRTPERADPFRSRRPDPYLRSPLVGFRLAATAGKK